MYQRGNPTEVRILEIYASREAYESHKLVDTEAMDVETMAKIFEKMKKR